MDYLEGALLGRLWSDTDYENRRHGTAWFLFAFLFWGITAWVAYSVNRRGALAWPGSPTLWLILAICLLLVLPVVSSIYYRLPLTLRLPALALHILKYVSVFLAFWMMLAPRLRLNSSGSVGDVLAFLDQTAGNFIERNTEINHLVGLILSSLILIILGIIIFIVGLALFAAVPILFVKLVTLLQAVFDRLFLLCRLGFRRLYRQKRLLSQRGQVDHGKGELS